MISGEEKRTRRGLLLIQAKARADFWGLGAHGRDKSFCHGEAMIKLLSHHREMSRTWVRLRIEVVRRGVAETFEGGKVMRGGRTAEIRKTGEPTVTIGRCDIRRKRGQWTQR